MSDENLPKKERLLKKRKEIKLKNKRKQRMMLIEDCRAPIYHHTFYQTIYRNNWINNKQIFTFKS